VERPCFETSDHDQTSPPAKPQLTFRSGRAICRLENSPQIILAAGFCDTLKQRLIILLFLALGCVSLFAGVNEDYAAKIAPLIDPAKLATLKERRANPRVQKVGYWLEMARREKAELPKVVDIALKSVGMTNAEAAKLTKAALLRNNDIASKLGCFDSEGLGEMRQGKSPTVKAGPYRGDQMSVDHIIPFSVVPELDHVMANLEFLPLRMNASKSAKITQRQRSLAEQFFKAGLLSKEGLSAVRNRK